ncbi:uncharacterized protein LOC120629836 [Pararge aegeria]|nr:uncharacterized protein LOC120629836 [Pararge aegeria]
MFVFNTVLVASVLLFKCDAGIVDTLQKCSIKNDECMSASFQKSVREIGSDGIPELDIPPIDPMHIQNASVVILGGITVTITEGVVKGISKCQIKKLHIDLDKQVGTQEVLCDLTIKGHVTIGGSSPTIKGLLGTSSIDGNGKGKVKLDKLYLNFDFPIYPIKKEDGNTYFKVFYENVDYKYDIEKATFAAEKILIGKDDITQLVVPYLNTNFKTLMKNIGKNLMDKAMEYFHDFSKKYFEGIPTKNYITEDLSDYVKN